MTFLGRFTLLGRVRKQWTDAMADPESARAITLLREVRPQFPERPEAADLWPAFQQDFLSDRFAPHRTAQDLVELRDTGARLAAASGGALPLDQAWYPVIACADPALAQHMLTGLYSSPLASEAGRIAAAVELAQRGACEDEHLSIYAELPTRTSPVPAPVAALVDRLLHVDLDSDPGRLGQAARLARLQLDAGHISAGTSKAFGLQLLRDGHDLASAVRHLTEAARIYPTDQAVFTGLLAARMRLGDHVGVTAADRPGRPSSALIEQLLALGRVLNWLESPDAADVPRSTAAGLAGLSLGPYAGPWLDYAVGRLHLIEGDARSATAVLVPAATQTLRPSWVYHAGWALLLAGDLGAGLADLFHRMPPGPASWTIACLLLDTKPGLDRNAEFEDALDAASPSYVPLSRAGHMTLR
jgi:hypothetical protein